MRASALRRKADKARAAVEAMERKVQAPSEGLARVMESVPNTTTVATTVAATAQDRAEEASHAAAKLAESAAAAADSRAATNIAIVARARPMDLLGRRPPRVAVDTSVQTAVAIHRRGCRCRAAWTPHAPVTSAACPRTCAVRQQLPGCCRVDSKVRHFTGQDAFLRAPLKAFGVCPGGGLAPRRPKSFWSRNWPTFANDEFRLPDKIEIGLREPSSGTLLQQTWHECPESSLMHCPSVC